MIAFIMETSRIRKQVYDLTLADLSIFPAWEFALDEEGELGQDEATVRPCASIDQLGASDGGLVVAASFELADGTKLHGYVTPTTSDEFDLGTMQPIIITEAGQQGFWHGILEPTQEEITAAYRRLGNKSAPEVFPIHFTSNMPLRDGCACGEVPGFLVLDAAPVRSVRVIK